MNRSKKLLALFTAGAALMLSSCGDNIVENYERSITTEATLNVVVRDGSSGSLINDAEVTLLTDPRIEGDRDSSKIGTVTFKGVRVGTDHAVQVKKSGFTGRIYNEIDIEVPSLGSTYIADDNTVIVDIYPRTAGLTGYLHFDDVDGVKKPAVNAEVRFVFTGAKGKTFDTTYFTSTKVDAAGLYTFTGLPAVGDVTSGSGFEFELIALEDGNYKEQKFTHGVSELTVGTTPARANEHTYSTAAADLVVPFMYMGTTSITVGPSEAVVLNFNDTIDVAKIATIPFKADNQAFDIVYGVNTVTLKPLNKWDAALGNFDITYTTSSLISKKGYSISSINDIKVNVLSTTNLSGLVVTGLHIDTIATTNAFIPTVDDGNVYLRWNTVKDGAAVVTDINSYVVYYKLKDTDNYTKVTTFASCESFKDTTTLVTLPKGLLNDNTYTFVVQAENASSKSNIEGSAKVVLSSRPTVNGLGQFVLQTGVQDASCSIPDAINTFDNFSNWLYNSLTTTIPAGGTPLEYKFILEFTERMDVGSTPTTAVDITFLTGVSSRISASRVWNDDFKSMTVTVRVGVGDALTTLGAQPEAAVFSITGLKSRSGNDFFVQYTNGVTAAQKANDIYSNVKSSLDFKARILVIN